MRLNKKNKLLLLGLVISLYISYEFAISNTIHYYSKYKQQHEILANDFNNPEMLQKLVYKEKQLNSLLTQYNYTEKGSFQNRLLQELTILAKKNNLRIIDFQEPHAISTNELTTTSYVFSLEGSFNGILLLINNIENNPSLGTIKHIAFTKKRNYKTNTDYLTTEIILQKSDSKTIS